MKTLFNKILSAAALIGLGLLGINEASAQNFHMSGASATYNATCSAVIKLSNTTSQIQTTSNDFGSDNANVIEGIVDWAAAGAQTVQALHYEKLVVSGSGSKVVPTGVFVYGLTDATCTPLLPAYSETDTYPFSIDIAGPSVTFAGTFTYAGGAAPTDNQTIFPVSTSTGGPDYDDLALTGVGDKTVAAADAIEVTGQLSSIAGTNLAIAGDLTLGTDASALNGTLELDGPDALNPANLNIGTNTLTFNDDVTIGIGFINSSDNGAGPDDGDVIVSATGTLALTDDNSVLNFDGTELVITGEITNGGTGANLDFTCTSIVTYDGNQTTQNILPTINTNPYGILNLANGNKQPHNYYTNDDVYVCSTFDLQDGNLDMATNDGSLFMKAAAATYSDLAEVVGRMTRTPDFVTPTDIVDGTYTYNNTATTVTFGGAAANPTELTLDITPGATTFNGYAAATDVKREVVLSHDATANFGLAVQVGYRFEEGPLAGPGYWDGTNSQTSLRMFEGFAANTSEKIGTGNTPTRSAAVASTSLGSVALTGINYTATSTNPNDIDKFYSSNNIILRSGPTTFYTKADGRWTNPNTWDEGARPTAADKTEIRHMVYVGINGPFAGTIGEPANADNELETFNTLSENAAYPGGISAAQSIEIATGYTNASLIIGNEDNGGTFKFRTEVNDATSFVNNNTNATSGVNFPSDLAKTGYAKTNFNGLWVMYGNTNWSMTNVPVLNTYNVLNLGSINNEGIIEVGE